MLNRGKCLSFMFLYMKAGLPIFYAKIYKKEIKKANENTAHTIYEYEQTAQTVLIYVRRFCGQGIYLGR